MTDELTRAVVGAVADALAELGLRKRQIGFLTCELNEHCLGWLSIGTASEGTPHIRRVWPKVGVRHQEAERIVARLRGLKSHAYLPPTITTGLGYVTAAHKWVEWPFARGDDWSEPLAEISEAVRIGGLPWMRDRASLSNLVASVTDERMSLRERYVLPVLLRLDGRPGEADDCVSRFVNDIGVRDDPAASEYRQFAAAFRAQRD